MMIVRLSITLDNETGAATAAGLPVRLDWERRSNADGWNPAYLAERIQTAIRAVAEDAVTTIEPHVKHRDEVRRAMS